MARKSPATAGPTINDLAQHLGVHKSTVSRARWTRRAPPPHRAQRAACSAWKPPRANWAGGPTAPPPRCPPAAAAPWACCCPTSPTRCSRPILRGIEDGLDDEGYFALLANTARREGGQGGRAGGGGAHAGAARGRLHRRHRALRDDAWLEGLRVGGARIVLVNQNRRPRPAARRHQRRHAGHAPGGGPPGGPGPLPRGAPGRAGLLLHRPGAAHRVRVGPA